MLGCANLDLIQVLGRNRLGSKTCTDEDEPLSRRADRDDPGKANRKEQTSGEICEGDGVSEVILLV